ncbi:hypothetical protein A1Q_0393 [Vibrio campbellii HY01]|nr:hypothetical protein A1Q_0393 [Vibrio campbellii HY01]
MQHSFATNGGIQKATVSLSLFLYLFFPIKVFLIKTAEKVSSNTPI